MPTDISEKGLETILVEYLRDKQGYEQGVSDDYKKQYGVDTERVKRFILSTQKEKAISTGCFANDNEERKFFTPSRQSSPSVAFRMYSEKVSDISVNYLICIILCRRN